MIMQDLIKRQEVSFLLHTIPLKIQENNTETLAPITSDSTDVYSYLKLLGIWLELPVKAGEPRPLDSGVFGRTYCWSRQIENRSNKRVERPYQHMHGYINFNLLSAVLLLPDCEIASFASRCAKITDISQGTELPRHTSSWTTCCPSSISEEQVLYNLPTNNLVLRTIVKLCV